MWRCARDYTVRPDYFKTVGEGKMCRGWDLWKSTNLHLLHRQESKSIKQDVKPPAEVVRTCWNRPRLQQRASCSINCALWEQPENRVSHTPSATFRRQHEQEKAIHLHDCSTAIEKPRHERSNKIISVTFSQILVTFCSQRRVNLTMERHFRRSVWDTFAMLASGTLGKTAHGFVGENHWVNWKSQQAARAFNLSRSALCILEESPTSPP